MKTKFTIAFTDYEFENLQIEEQLLSGLNIEVLKGQCQSDQEVIALAKNADGIINQYAPINEKVINNLSKCKVISRYGVGVNTIDVDAATKYGICIANVTDYGVEEVSNHAMALILNCARKVVTQNNLVKKGIWDFKDAVPLFRLSQQTLGLIGYGRNSRSLAEKAKVFGMRIFVYDPFVSNEDIANSGVTPTDLEKVIQGADYLSLHIPLTKDTKSFINREHLTDMKSNAFIINTSRGEIINENDLIEALNNKQIAGAALDVLEKEPISSNHPFMKMENVVMTPHSAWYTEESMKELRTKTVQNIIDVMEGKFPTYLVNSSVKNHLSLSSK